MNHGEHEVEWIDGKRWPTQKPHPAFPNGVDLPAANPKAASCKVFLPYPAKRIGTYLVKCKTCRQTVLVTTAGRPDDPRSVTLNCNLKGLQ